MGKPSWDTTIVEAEAVCCGIPMDTSYTSCNCSSGDASGATTGLARHQDDKVGDVEAGLRATWSPSKLRTSLRCQWKNRNLLDKFQPTHLSSQEISLLFVYSIYWASLTPLGFSVQHLKNN